MQSGRWTRLWLAGVFIGTCGISAPLSAQECFGGYSCDEAAEAAFDFRMARDCPDVVAIDPAKRGEYGRIMSAIRNRPLAGLRPDQFTDVPTPLPGSHAIGSDGSRCPARPSEDRACGTSFSAPRRDDG